MRILIILLLPIVATNFADKAVQMRKKKTEDLAPVDINVTNWKSYRLDEKIQVKSLRDVLDKMSSFKRVEECPLGPGKCSSTSIAEVVRKLIGSALNSERLHALKLKQDKKAALCAQDGNATDGELALPNGHKTLKFIASDDFLVKG